MGVQAEQLAAVKGEHRVVQAAIRVVLVKDGWGAQQRRVPAGAALQVGHGHCDVGYGGETGHDKLLDGGCSVPASPS